MSTTKVTDAMIDGVAASKLTGALPAISGASLTALPATLPASSGVNLTALNATNLGSGTASVARGGTGAGTHTANNVLVGNGTSAIASVAPSTSGNVLTSNGSAWTSAAAAAGGKLLQMVSFPFTDVFNTSSTTPVDSGITVNITPSATSSKIWVVAHITWHGGGSTAEGSMFLYRGGSVTAYIADANGSAVRATHSVAFIHGYHGDSQLQSTFSYLDSPSSTSSLTYAVYVSVASGQTIYINRDATDSTAAAHGRSASSITCVEYGA